MLQGLQGKTVMVTGAAGAIGSEACKKLIGEGANVVAVDLAPEALATELGSRCIAVKADVRNARGAAAGVEAAVERFGALDCAFLNAGVEPKADLLVNFSESQYERVFDVNVRGVFLTAQAVVKQMLGAGKPGNILFMASIAGLQGGPATSIYNASKHAVVGAAKSLALEVGPLGLRVNILCPGIVESRMFSSLEKTIGEASGMSPEQTHEAMVASVSLRRYAQPSEIAALATWILSDEAPYCHGETFTIGGGLMA